MGVYMGFRKKSRISGIMLYTNFLLAFLGEGLSVKSFIGKSLRGILSIKSHTHDSYECIIC